MVYVAGERTPTFTHASIDNAETEAKRLAKLLEKKVYILASIKSIEVNEFKIEDCRADDDLPF